MWAQQEQRSPARIVSGAGSLKSPDNQGLGVGEGWGRFFSKAASKGLPSPFNAAGWRCSKPYVLLYLIGVRESQLHSPD